MLAWLSLFIPAESVPGRVGMGMTTLLTLTAMFSSVRRDSDIVCDNYSSCQVRQSVPRVSYISFLDIWMLFCMIFVFSCILEFIITTIFIRAGRKGDADRVREVKIRKGKTSLIWYLVPRWNFPILEPYCFRPKFGNYFELGIANLTFSYVMHIMLIFKTYLSLIFNIYTKF